jgi:hypothetical protein
MAERQNLAIDEDRRIQQHESVKGEVRRQVHTEIAGQVNTTHEDRAREAAAAESLKRQAVDEVTGTERELTRGRTVARGSQIIDYAFYLVYGIIGLAIALEAIGARQSAGFKQFVDALAWPFVAPFRGIMNDPAVGSSQFMLSFVVALAAYLMLHLAINGLLRLFAERKTTI